MGSLIRSFVQSILKMFNAIIGMTGMAMVLYSLWMIHVWHKQTGHSPFDDDYPVPWQAFSIFLSVLFWVHLFLSGTWGTLLCDYVLRSYCRGDFEWLLPSLPHKPNALIELLPSKSRVNTAYISSYFKRDPRLFTSVGFVVVPFHRMYMMLMFLLLVLEGVLIADVFLNHNWEQDFPKDATGNFQELEKFIKENFDFCKWIGLTILVAQSLDKGPTQIPCPIRGVSCPTRGMAFLLGIVLKALGPHQERNYESDEEYSASRRPLLRNAVEPSPYVVVDPLYGTRKLSFVAKDHEVAKSSAYTDALGDELPSDLERACSSRRNCLMSTPPPPETYTGLK
ncbi:hypothetical protein Cgig2_018929 [Carnegiea gigantea]|uniref:Uncharacterized protein n=1 Tax=Carnegiea gigantea TaxID=171969 RepID=A0A9Q1K5L7_9CARY|nr:hypothetical protein Cgig2_018929 [Carnegiea gigantea]